MNKDMGYTNEALAVAAKNLAKETRKSVVVLFTGYRKEAKALNKEIDETEANIIVEELKKIESPQKEGIILINTLGGYVHATERIIEALIGKLDKNLRPNGGKFKKLIVVIAGRALSSGTTLACAGDEIWMRDVSVLGPTDVQIGGCSVHDIIYWEHVAAFDNDVMLRRLDDPRSATAKMWRDKKKREAFRKQFSGNRDYHEARLKQKMEFSHDADLFLTALLARKKVDKANELSWEVAHSIVAKHLSNPKIYSHFEKFSGAQAHDIGLKVFNIEDWPYGGLEHLRVLHNASMEELQKKPVKDGVIESSVIHVEPYFEKKGSMDKSY